MLLVALVAFFIAHSVVPAARKQSAGFLAYYAAAQVIMSGEDASRLYDDRWFAKRVLALSDGKITDVYLAMPSGAQYTLTWVPSLNGPGEVSRDDCAAFFQAMTGPKSS